MPWHSVLQVDVLPSDLLNQTSCAGPDRGMKPHQCTSRPAPVVGAAVDVRARRKGRSPASRRQGSARPRRREGSERRPGRQEMAGEEHRAPLGGQAFISLPLARRRSRAWRARLVALAVGAGNNHALPVIECRDVDRCGFPSRIWGWRGSHQERMTAPNQDGSSKQTRLRHDMSQMAQPLRRVGRNPHGRSLTKPTTVRCS